MAKTYSFTASSASKMPVGALCFLNEVKVALNNQGIKWQEKTGKLGEFHFDILDAPKDICDKFACMIDTCMEVCYEVLNMEREDLKQKQLHKTVHLLDGIFDK